MSSSNILNQITMVCYLMISVQRNVLCLRQNIDKTPSNEKVIEEDFYSNNISYKFNCGNF